MIRLTHRIVAGVGILAAALSLVYGVYLPFQKSTRYIDAIANLQTARLLDDVLRGYDHVFNFSSPVGGEEVSKFTAYDILNMVSNPRQPEQVARELVRYIEPRLDRENVRHLLVLAQLHTTLWQRFKGEEDYIAAERYYRDAYTIGPKLPPVLFGLLSLYGAKGDTVKATEIGDRIVALWPNATDVGRQIEAQQTFGTSSKPK